MTDKKIIKEILLLHDEACKHYNQRCKEDEDFALGLLTDPNGSNHVLDMAVDYIYERINSMPEEPEQNQVVLYGLTGSVNEEGSARGKEYVCPKCGGHMNLDTSAICASIPPKYRLVCDNCHYLDFVDCSEVRKEEPVLPGTEQYEDKIAWRDYVPVDAVEAAERCGKWKIVPIEPASEDLDKEIAKYFKGWYNDDEYKDACKPDYTGVSVEECKDIARHFANWQNEQMAEALRTEYEKGRYDMREEMMKQAVNGQVVESANAVSDSKDVIDRYFSCVCSFREYQYLPTARDKVRLLIMKEDEHEPQVHSHCVF